MSSVRMHDAARGAWRFYDPFSRQVHEFRKRSLPGFGSFARQMAHSNWEERLNEQLDCCRAWLIWTTDKMEVQTNQIWAARCRNA